MAKQRWYRFPLYLLVRAGAGLLWILPRKVLLFLAEGMGDLGFFLVPRQRKKTIRHLTRVYGKEKSAAEIRKLARAVFRNFTVCAVEILQFSKLNAEKVLKIVHADEALRIYRKILEEGRGLIVLTPHLGNWELLAAVCCLSGLPGTVVARRIYYEPYNQWITGLRKAVKAETLYRESASREVLKRLAANGVIGILPDQDIDSLRGIFVDYFGIPAYTPVAPVRLSITTGAPMVTSFLVRTSWDGYTLKIGNVYRPGDDQEDRDRVVRKYTELWMRDFESMIRQYPEQWGWMHDRWKTRPEQELNENLNRESVKKI